MVKVSSVCVYCGSSAGHDTRHRLAAVQLGRLLAERAITLVYGGGGVGMMGILAEATLSAGGQVVGIIPRFLERAEKGVHTLTRLEIVDSMHERKERMFALADAFIVLPGGIGTLDEAFEILTWKQLALHDKPIVLVDLEGYWRPLETLIGHVVTEGFAHPRIHDLFQLVPSVEAALAAIAAAPQPAVAPVSPERL